MPNERLTAKFNADSVLELTPALVGATETQQSGIIGERVDLNLVHTKDVRPSQVLYELTSHLVLNKWRDEDGQPRLNLFTHPHRYLSPVRQADDRRSPARPVRTQAVQAHLATAR